MLHFRDVSVCVKIPVSVDHFEQRFLFHVRASASVRLALLAVMSPQNFYQPLNKGRNAMYSLSERNIRWTEQIKRHHNAGKKRRKPK